MMVIINEGPHHLAVFKPANMCVVGGENVPKPTLLDLVRKERGKQIFPVHRLDRGTTGIVLFAKSLFAKMAIENAFKKRLVKKTYLAICEGKPNFNKLNIEKRLKRRENLQTIDEKGDFAQTIVKFKEQLNDDLSLIEATPISGRMHQIRIHLASIGLPILGDELYGAKQKLLPHTLGLFAVGLSLPGPKGGRIEIDIKNMIHIQKLINLKHPTP